MEVARFSPFASAPKVSFWQALGARKLREWRLDESEQRIHGLYFAGTKGAPARLEVTSAAFESAPAAPRGACVAPGSVRVCNTVEGFRAVDKNAQLACCAQQLLADFESGAVLRDPSLLARFSLLVFADLKTQRYVYWFAFAALMLQPPAAWRRPPSELALDAADAAVVRQALASACVVACVRSAPGEPLEAIALADLDARYASEDGVARAAAAEDGLLFCCLDPSGSASQPGWPARNLLALLSHRWRVTSVRLVCCRAEVMLGSGACCAVVLHVGLDCDAMRGCEASRATGWEVNANGRLGPRSVELAQLSDPSELAHAAATLNLELMRWRLLPDLDVETLARSKCLLLGAGTLGCNVARNLVAWGVRAITLVDSGKVSYSNPARQSLYTVEDAALALPKAEAAAKALERIAPGTPAKPSQFVGRELTIMMPGHALPASGPALDAARAEFEELEALVKAHDCVFLLTDTREARWLPTLLAAKHDTLLINVALGLDTYVVQRHGAADEGRGDDEAGCERLGCYFCNDVVAPTDSSKDRTLDQQCTVSRPGLAPIASALAVELFVALQHHPRRHRAPADAARALTQRATSREQPLGLLPHSIRGFLTHFSSVLPHTRAFEHCAACSEPVMQAYAKDGFQFVRQVAQDPTTLENVAGLTDLHSDVCVGFDDADEDDF